MSFLEFRQPKLSHDTPSDIKFETRDDFLKAATALPKLSPSTSLSEFYIVSHTGLLLTNEAAVPDENQISTFKLEQIMIFEHPGPDIERSSEIKGRPSNK